jgi:hypothetical protein
MKRRFTFLVPLYTATDWNGGGCAHAAAPTAQVNRPAAAIATNEAAAFAGVGWAALMMTLRRMERLLFPGRISVLATCTEKGVRSDNQPKPLCRATRMEETAGNGGFSNQVGI